MKDDEADLSWPLFASPFIILLDALCFTAKKKKRKLK